MPGDIKVLNSDVFSERAGLAVLPCATDGTLKDFARKTREELKLPKPPTQLSIGSLRLYKLADLDLPVRRLAYVAVRDRKGSSPEILRTVGLRLGELAAKDRRIDVISAPLLGTGAGHVPLVPAIEALAEGFRERAPEQASLTLCAPRSSTFQKVKKWLSVSSIRWRRPLRVFLSYNKATQSAWVKDFCDFLRRNGVDARIDQSELKLTMKLKAWMREEIARADKVVIVSDPVYARKADRMEGGVGYETSIIKRELRRRVRVEKYLVIVRAKDLESGTPRYLEGRYVRLQKSGDPTHRIFAQLLKDLRDPRTRPPLRRPPVYL